MDRTVAIELHGSVTNGLWSAERGEGRYAQNLAAVLAASGRKVLGFGSWAPGIDPWGVCPRIPDVEIITHAELRERGASVVVDSGHSAGKPDILPGTPLVKVAFSVASSCYSFREFFYRPDIVAAYASAWPANHRLAYAYPHLADLFAAIGPHTGRLLPFPVLPLAFWDRFLPTPTPWPRRDGILLGTKPVHPTQLGSLAGRVKAEWERIALETAEASGEPVTVIQGTHYMPEHRRLAPGAATTGILPLHAALGLMRTVTVAFDNPISGIFPLECVLEGCCPMAWRHGYNPALAEAADRVDPTVVLDAAHPDAAAFRRVADRLLADDDLREDLLYEYGRELDPHGPETVLRCWEGVERWIG